MSKIVQLVKRIEYAVDRLEDLVIPKPAWWRIADRVFYLIILSMILFSLIFGIWIVVERPQQQYPKHFKERGLI